MDPRRLPAALTLAVPGLLLAAAGLAHPHLLTVAHAREWWLLHIWLLPVFPLLAFPLVWLLRGDPRPVAWAARLAGFGFAVAYSALDAVAGIAAGLVVDVTGQGQPEITGRLFEIADRIGHAGIWALAAAVAFTAGALWPRYRMRVLPGTALFLAGLPWFYQHHIFTPRGAWAMVLLAAGTALLALAPTRDVRAGPGAAPRRSGGSPNPPS